MQLDDVGGVLFQTLGDVGVEPRPEVEVPDEQVPHDTIDFAEAGREGDRRSREGLDEAGLVLLPVESQNERFLARFHCSVGSPNQDTGHKI